MDSVKAEAGSWLGVEVDTRRTVVVVDVEVEVTSSGDGSRENDSISPKAPLSLALSAAPRSNGAHLEAFFFFLNVYLNGPRDSRLTAFASTGSELSFVENWRLRLVDMAASANVRGPTGSAATEEA
jgi:gamma-glutamyl:cysteine ligase YbdK (ATP-grasp superfamily)